MEIKNKGKVFIMEIIYFVHGTTFDNATSKCSGWRQVELNDLGKQQAIDLGKNTDYNFDVIFTSDLIRAIETSKLAWPDVKKVVDPRLRECNYGDFDGKDSSLVKFNDHIEIEFPNGESLRDVEKRIRDFLNDIKLNYEDSSVGIIAHRATQLAIEVISKNISWEEAIQNDWRKTKEWKPGWKYRI